MRWIVRGLAVLVGIILLVVVIVYAGSEWILRKSHTVPTVAVTVPHDAASIAEGARIARIASCRECHGANGEGKVLFEVPMVGRVAPPPLAAAALDMTDAELARAVRYGVHKDGSSLFIMPTHALSHISDDDLGRVIAWIRSLRQGPEDSKARTVFGPVGRALVLADKLPTMATSVMVAQKTRPADIGRYYVDIACLACHKLTKEGVMEDGKMKVPALAPMAASYDADKFRHLMRTGEGMGKRDLGLMSVVAKAGFAAMTDQEIAAVQSYLKGEAEKMPPR
ncbi:c-type cytochrome [Sphingomonas sp. JC676]|uniref:c-type cytochrome n=1 Tax=Sphingomonas sp. JC676 TaxID=2768065 RepID=UPI0016577874|nr:c-type cytochrome [Sphingomonas sp. JC676]MBC9033663.1 c-type cytochrome [Sphingomonas sp. JC676]